MITEKQVEKGISNIVGALTDPIIVHPGGWGDTLPEWIKTSITLERLAMNMKALKGEEPTGTDAEACAYLYAASLVAPMDGNWSQIYLYTATQTMKRWKKTEVPPDIAVDSLNDYQMEELRRLKEWLYRKRVSARQERDQVERRQKKEKEKEAEKVLQPSMFEF